MDSHGTREDKQKANNYMKKVLIIIRHQLNI